MSRQTTTACPTAQEHRSHGRLVRLPKGPKVVVVVPVQSELFAPRGHRVTPAALAIAHARLTPHVSLYSCAQGNHLHTHRHACGAESTFVLADGPDALACARACADCAEARLWAGGAR